MDNKETKKEEKKEIKKETKEVKKEHKIKIDKEKEELKKKNTELKICIKKQRHMMKYIEEIYNLKHHPRDWYFPFVE